MARVGQMTRHGDSIPRRCDTTLHTPVETALLEASLAVEAMGADTRLTMALGYLEQARALVSDVIDDRLVGPVTPLRSVA